MSWMITDQSTLKDSCYIEILPGKYENQHWDPQSVFFEEEHFCFIEPTIVRHCPKHDHYSFTDINSSLWNRILNDLERFHQRIMESNQSFEFHQVIEEFCTVYAHERLKAEADYIKQLCQSLNDFIRWVRMTLESHDTIAVLGL